MARGKTLDFGLLAQNMNASSFNSTSEMLQLPAAVLEAFIPGYSFLSRLLLDFYGLDAAYIVSIALYSFAAAHAALYVWRVVSRWLVYFFTSSVYINDSDELFDTVLEWMGEQHVSGSSRNVRAVTRKGSRKAGVEDELLHDAVGEGGLFNFSRWAARVPPRYEPEYGRYWFWFGARPFVFIRSRSDAQRTLWPGYGSGDPDVQRMRLACLGRSTEPVKLLLHHIKQWTVDRERSMTQIKRPAGKDRGRGGTWDKATSRPSRPIETVSLEPGQKARIIADVNEFLHPTSPAWYATRGIPYRRGYLFSGPPGTGKTSLSFALAGIFGLDIHVISLLDPMLNETDLLRLFNNLPRRCVVLLEDIDTAGMRREDTDKKAAAESAAAAAATTTTNKWAASTRARAQNASAADSTDPSSLAAGAGGAAPGNAANPGISLSGLLNAIDGVASHEGRILVMTTNRPHALDDALLRPGRTDMHVRFSLATRVQAADIFERMYAIPALSAAEKLIPELKGADGEAEGEKYAGYDAPAHDIPALAAEFARLIPDRELSPAELQGFLLTRKKAPRRAVEEVVGWIREVIEERERRGRGMEETSGEAGKEGGGDKEEGKGTERRDSKTEGTLLGEE